MVLGEVFVRQTEINLERLILRTIRVMTELAYSVDRRQLQEESIYEGMSRQKH